MVLLVDGLVTGLGCRVVELHLGQAVEVELLACDLESVAAVRAGSPVRLRWSRPFDAAYVTSTVVRATRLVDGATRVVLPWPETVERQQARAAVRAPLTAAVSLAAAGPRRLVDGGAGWVHGTAVDVSAGGLGVVMGAGFGRGHLILVRYDVPGRHADVHVDARAEVVRSAAVPARPHLVHLGLALRDVPAAMEGAVMQAVFQLLHSRVQPRDL